MDRQHLTDTETVFSQTVRNVTELHLRPSHKTHTQALKHIHRRARTQRYRLKPERPCFTPLFNAGCGELDWES